MKSKAYINVAVGLWALHGATLIAGATIAQVNPVAIADIAREKDIVWLSLATAIIAIGFSAWLVKQMLAQQARTIAALEGLRGELKNRPCFVGHIKEGTVE